MPFLILSRRGYEDLKAAGPVSGMLWLNPGVLSDQEIVQLRGMGARLEVLPQWIDPRSPPEREAALQRLAQAGGAPLWVEYAPAGIDEPRAAGQPPETQATLRRAQEQAAKLALQAARRLKRLAAADGAAIILPYMSYGTAQHLAVRGRVLKDEGFIPPQQGHSGWRNLVELYKRLGSDEVPGARLCARFQDVEQEIVADDAGYFHAGLSLRQPLAAGWHTVALRLLDPAPAAGQAARAEARVLVPPATARFGVISDIDDTVLWSNVTNKLRMLKMLAVSNAHTRKPFKGVTAFYRALHEGASGADGNPLFYVSSSPWHLYTPLVDFFQSQGIPLGPLLLKELGVRSLFGAGRHQDHKLKNIEQILRTYPQLPFVLIGDSGQEDPEIYKEVVLRHPGRIRTIYIRNVDPDPARIEAIDRLIDEVRSSGTQLVLATDSEYAAAHAAGEGLIAAGLLADVRADKRGEEARAAAPHPV